MVRREGAVESMTSKIQELRANAKQMKIDSKTKGETEERLREELKTLARAMKLESNNVGQKLRDVSRRLEIAAQQQCAPPPRAFRAEGLGSSRREADGTTQSDT